MPTLACRCVWETTLIIIKASRSRDIFGATILLSTESN